MRMHLLRLPSIVVYLLVVKLVISRGEKKLLGVAVLARVGGGRVYSVADASRYILSSIPLYSSLFCYFVLLTNLRHVHPDLIMQALV